MENGALLRQINKEIEDYKTKQVTVIPGLSYNQYDTLNDIIFAYNSKFQTGEVDEDGDRKYYRNINRNPCKVYSKAIDFDTKNIRLLTAGGGEPLKTWFMERGLKYWMRDKQFGKVLNRIFSELPIFGSVVIKIVNGTPFFVDLRNFIVEQGADSLDQMNHIIEIHNFTVSGFRKAAKQMGWDNEKVEKVIKEFHETKKSSHIRVFERYGDVADISESGKTTYTYKRVFVADVGVDQYDQRNDLTVKHTGTTLKEEAWDEHPYWEIHAEKLPGRWLGLGVVETLKEAQIRINELSNLQAKSSYWMSLHVFQTRDPAFNRNLNGDVRNGETLNVDSEIQEVVISDRNLAHFNEEDNKWFRNRDEMTFSYDVVQGERLPAGTPLGSAQIAQTQTLSYFEQIQENVALVVKEMLYTDIIPQFLKESTAKHTLRLVGKDLETFIEMCKNELVFKELIRIAINDTSGPFPTEDDKIAVSAGVEEAIKQGKEKILDIPRGYYDGIKYDVDIDITGESVDTRVRYATKFAILQAITSDPTMTTDPVKLGFLYSMAEDGGVNLVDILGTNKKKAEEMMPEPQGRAGGGVSAPAIGQALQGQASQTI